MSDERNKLSLRHWIAAMLIGLPILYVAAFGPTFWLYSRSMTTPVGHFVNRFYHPIIRTWKSGPEWIADPIGWYANAGAIFKLYPAQSLGGDVFVARSAN